MYEPGDVITRGAFDFFYVYELLDDDMVRFYVGVTATPDRRIWQYTTPKTARTQNPALGQKIAAVSVLKMRILSRFSTRAEALEMERLIIKAEPWLLNFTGHLKKGQSHRPYLAEKFLTGG